MTDNTVETLLTALRAGWEGNPSPLVDEEWCWVTEAREPAPDSYGPTLTVHRCGDKQIDYHTTYLRPIRPNDPIEQRCENCERVGTA
jgi:hypothetical protein